jgi:hypothetical protein
VLLPAEAQTSAAGGEVTLVLYRDVVAWSQSYTMHIHERSYIVNPRRIVESGEDFDIVSFSLQSA